MNIIVFKSIFVNTKTYNTKEENKIFFFLTSFFTSFHLETWIVSLHYSLQAKTQQLILQFLNSESDFGNFFFL